MFQTKSFLAAVVVVVFCGPLFSQNQVSWKTSDILVDCIGPSDSQGRLWYEVDFDDTSWESVSLPYRISHSTPADLFFRGRFTLDSIPERILLSFASDDGLWIYINGQLVDHFGAECHEIGCVNLCGVWNNPVPSIDITAYLQVGENIIAAHVSNCNCGGFMHFEAFLLPPLELLEGSTGNIYEFVFQPRIPWEEANILSQGRTLQGAQGHLATITTFEEDEFLNFARQQIITNHNLQAALHKEFWVGGFQLPDQPTPRDGWRWVNNEGLIPGVNGTGTYTNWLPNEPNDCCTPDEDNQEHGLAIGWNNQFGWNDEGSAPQYILGLIVEYEAGVINQPPQITHEPISRAPVGQSIQVHFGLADEDSAISSAELYFRKGGGTDYTSIPITPLPNQRDYTLTIVGQNVTYKGVEYYLKATDEFGVFSTHGSPDNPHRICVTTPDGRVQLKIYDSNINNGTFVDLCPGDSRFNPTYGTAVIVHGWNPNRGFPCPPFCYWDGDINYNSSNEKFWALGIAKEIDQRFNSNINILAWDWIREATGTEDESYGHIREQSELLANILKYVIPNGYDEPIHFMGHSNGSHIVTVVGLELLEPRTSESKILKTNQVTLWDPPDLALIFLTTPIEDYVRRLRFHDVYVELYHGITSLHSYAANLWVNVPLYTHFVYNWYRDTILGVDPQLYQSVCSDEIFNGTVGFGTSALLYNLKSRPESPPGPCREQGTLKFGPVTCPLKFSRPFVFLGAEDCQIIQTPVPLNTFNFSDGTFWFDEGCLCGNPDSTTIFLGTEKRGQGGGAQADILRARYTLELEISSEYDYLSFEFDFTASPQPSVLSFSIIDDDTVFPIFEVQSDYAMEDDFRLTGLLDVRMFEGKSVILNLELISTEPGAVVYIRNLTPWKDFWHDNNVPQAHAGKDQILPANKNGIAAVSLDGSATIDEEGDELTFWWTVNGEIIAEGINPIVDLPVGVYPIILVVRDPADSVDTDEVMVVVEFPFKRGDSNSDRDVDISDAINILWFLFTGNGKVSCLDAADANDSGDLDISDPIYTLGFLFIGANPEPLEPFHTIGLDPTPDDLGCERY